MLLSVSAEQYGRCSAVVRVGVLIFLVINAGVCLAADDTAGDDNVALPDVQHTVDR